MSHPRVLVVSANPFNRSHNNSLTLSSLFEGWPADRLAQLYVPFVTPVPPAFDVCRTMWALTPRGVRRVRPVEGPAAAPRITPGRRVVLRLAESRVLQKLAYPARELVYSRPALLQGPEMEEVDRFAPEVVFSLLGSLSMLRTALALSDRWGVPIVPFVTDDWITTEYRHVFGAGYLRREMARAFDAVLERAPVRAVISDAMAEEYARRYGGEFVPFTRCLPAGRFRASPPPARPDGTVELVYAGQVGLGRWRALRRIGEQLQALAAEGMRARLTVYTLPAHAALYARELTLGSALRMGGHVANDALPDIYDAADAVVHVESFDAETARYTALSLSTKISEYLMAGRPVFAFGPAHLGSMRHLSASGAGVVVGRDSDEALRDALRALVGDRARRVEMGTRARAFALERHESVRQREAFRALLARAAGSPAPLAAAG